MTQSPTRQADGALSSYRVLELGSFIAGPYCARLFADHGAEVIKVEPPVEGDVMRRWGIEYQGLGLQWPVIARNKRSITLNLRTEQGRALLREVIDRAGIDVLVENFRPGTLEKWGLGPRELHATHPDLVIVRISGYGQSGPHRDLPGFGSIGEAVGGLRYIVGDPQSPPVRMGVSMGDLLAGQFGFMGALMALLPRESGSRRGQVVDVALYEAVLATTESMIPEFDKAGVVRERTGAVLPGIAPSNAYPTADDRWILIAANSDSLFKRLAEEMERLEWLNPARYATHEARGQHQAELDEEIAEWTRTLTAAEILTRMADAGVPASAINRVDDIVTDPHILSRNMIVPVPEPNFGGELVRMPGVVPQLSETPGCVRLGGPLLGEANHHIFQEVLGMSPEHLSELQDSDVI